MLNKTDKKLISLLRVNARTSVSDLAKKIGVSRTTVQNRLDRLEQSGVIAGYTITLKPEVEKSQIFRSSSIAASLSSKGPVARQEDSGLQSI